MSGGIDRLSSLAEADAEAVFLACCGAPSWARRMAVGRPYRDAADLLQAADRVWWDLDPSEWLRAFATHPRIGERKRGDDQAGRWSAQEQAGAAAQGSVLADLAAAQRTYEERFGHIFIVCATGKSAEEMLALLRARRDNDAETELRAAAEEQRKITRLRLEKWLADA
jgi:OHCU decarboxylase